MALGQAARWPQQQPHSLYGRGYGRHLAMPMLTMLFRRPCLQLILWLLSNNVRAQETAGCFVTGLTFSEEHMLTNVSNPVEPVDSAGACQHLCQTVVGCNTFGYMISDLKCYLGNYENSDAVPRLVLSADAAAMLGGSTETRTTIVGPAHCPELPEWCTELPGPGFPGETVAETQSAWSYGAAPPNLQCWPRVRQKHYDGSCLKWQPYGCSSIKDMKECLISRDGSSLTDIQGLKINGQPCVWCDGGLCRSESTNMCEPMDFLLRGEGKAFTTFIAKLSHRVANCESQFDPPQVMEELACLTLVPGGCTTLRDKDLCLASREGRVNATFKSRAMYGQPCVWCGGGLCHDGNAAQGNAGGVMCEAFDEAFNGEGHSYVTLIARGSLTVAGCQNGAQHPLQLPAPSSPYTAKIANTDHFVDQLALCPGEQVQVLEDYASGWPGSCLNLRMKHLGAGFTCAQDCALNVSCASWQEVRAEGTAKQCWQGFGDNCFGYPGGRSILGAQMIMHGTYRVLKDLKGVQVNDLYPIFHATKFSNDTPTGIRYCNHTCLSYIACQAWTYSISEGCAVDRGTMPYPPTTAVMVPSGPEAGSVVAGEYIQRMCRKEEALVEARAILATTATTRMTFAATTTTTTTTPPPTTHTMLVFDTITTPVPTIIPLPHALTYATSTEPTTDWLTDSPTNDAAEQQPTSAPKLKGAATNSAAINGHPVQHLKTFAVVTFMVSLLLAAVFTLCTICFRKLRRRKFQPLVDDTHSPSSHGSSPGSPSSHGFSPLPPIHESSSCYSPASSVPTSPSMTPGNYPAPPMLPAFLPTAPAVPLPTSPHHDGGLTPPSPYQAPATTQVFGPAPVPPAMMQSTVPATMAAMPTTGMPPPTTQVGAFATSATRTQPFTAVIDRSAGGFLGIEVDYALDGNAVIVSAVSPGGQIAAWNAVQAGCQVLPGDKIVEVNGCREDTKAMMEQMRAYQVLNITVVPGWVPQAPG